MAEDDQDREKKVSELTLPEVKDQLQILEYIEINKPQDWTEGNRRLRHELEFREQQLLHDRRLDPKLEDLEKSLADRQAQESHDLSLAQTAELNRLGPSQQLTDRHRQEWEDQARKFAKERDRYIEEFHEAQRLLERLREREERDETKGLSH